MSHKANADRPQSESDAKVRNRDGLRGHVVLRGARWKYHHRPGDVEELYDIDPTSEPDSYLAIDRYVRWGKPDERDGVVQLKSIEQS